MSIWWLASLFALGCACYAQQSENAARPGPAGLILSEPGRPLSVEQVEERGHILANGNSTVDTLKSTIYRDSAGRLRIESFPDSSGEPPTVLLIDPTTGARVVLSVRDKMAHRIVGAKAGENGFVTNDRGMGSY